VKRNPVLTRLIALLLLPIILLMAPISSDYFSQGPVLAGSPQTGSSMIDTARAHVIGQFGYRI